MVKSVPANFNIDYCDFVSGDMWAAYPWKEGDTNIAPASLPLSDGVQDYSTPPQIFRALKFWLYRTDVTPNQYRTLDVVDDIDIDLTPRSFSTMRSASLQMDVGQIRLESAINVPTAGAYYIGGNFQQNYAKVVSLSDQCWFADVYASVAAKGLLYWLYQLTDDPRAGSAQVNNHGAYTYTGQLAVYHSALIEMQRSEDYGATTSLIGGEVLGGGRDISGLNIFGP